MKRNFLMWHHFNTVLANEKKQKKKQQQSTTRKGFGRQYKNRITDDKGGKRRGITGTRKNSLQTYTRPISLYTNFWWIICHVEERRYSDIGLIVYSGIVMIWQCQGWERETKEHFCVVRLFNFKLFIMGYISGFLLISNLSEWVIEYCEIFFKQNESSF